MKSKRIPPSVNHLHIGQLIKNHIDKRRIYKSALARKIQRDDSAILRYQRNVSLQTALLEELCHALKHNFFADLAAQLPPAYTTNVAADTTKDEHLAALQQENALLNAKNEALMEALKGTPLKNNKL